MRATSEAGRDISRHRQVGAHDGWAAGIDTRTEPLVDQLEGGLDADAAGRDPRQDLGDRLDRLAVHAHRQLEPAVGRCAQLIASLTLSKRPLSCLPVARLAGLSRELGQQLALALGQLGRDLDVDEHVQVATRARTSQVRHALAAQSDLGSGLGTGLDFDRLLAIGGRDGERRAERGLGDGQGQVEEELGVATLEARVWRDMGDDIQVAERTAPWARFALPRQSHLVALVDAGRHGHAQLAPPLGAPVTTACRAGLVDDLALAVAARTGADVDHLAEHRGADGPDLAAALALRAGHGRRARPWRRCRSTSRSAPAR